MTRSLYLLDNNIIVAFPRFSQSFQPHDALNIPLAEQHYSYILKALSKLSSPWHPQYFCCNTTLQQIHDALNRYHYSQIILIHKPLKSMRRSLYPMENNIMAAFPRFSQRFQINDALNISVENNIIVAFPRISQSFQIRDALNICCSTTL